MEFSRRSNNGTMCATFQAKYKILEKIGEGSFSEVLKCQDRISGALYAAKRLKKTYQNINEILDCPEVTAMRKISRHPNVLYMVESHYDALPGRVTLIFELMDMSLYDLMRGRSGRPVPESRVKSIVYQLLRGLEHLHRHGFFHRDIKPENILLKENIVKIGDLGSARPVYGRPPFTEYISTRWYRSPECLLTGGFYGPKMDVWAVGCVFYELLTLEPLFPGENEVDQIAKIHKVLGTPHARVVAKFRRIRTRNSEFYFPAREGRGLDCLLPRLSEPGLELLASMLVYDPENRAAARKLLDHRYFADLREREVTRQTRSTTLAGISSDSGQWRSPLVAGYLAAERNRRLRLPNACQSQVRCVDRARSARPVLPAPSPLPATTDAHRRLDEIRRTATGRYFLRNRRSNCHQTAAAAAVVVPNYRLNAQTKKWYDPNLQQQQRKSDENAEAQARQQHDVYRRQGFFLHDQNAAPATGYDYGSSQLPSIFLKPSRNIVCFANSRTYILGDNSGKVNLTDIQERPAGLLTRKTSMTRSPLKKMAKRELNDKTYHLRSASFEPSKLVPRKSCERRFKF